MDQKTSMGVLALAVLVMLFILAVMHNPAPAPGSRAGEAAGAGGQAAPLVEYGHQAGWWQHGNYSWNHIAY
ncbi:hypothetical protein [Desulfotomaculum copahuensis]|uniref:Uncharacterized protein n=1 Tax=Desulfotomaculum copahuensis TaxID=1838280 RepID=A0A1B7LJ46_9FIRM|nr:hypothetical protein [Desulfotomaculum copahuensis]OAT86492.1 hypothetical protein A6M21_03495 [Desulfotomaculum copahuensis]